MPTPYTRPAPLPHGLIARLVNSVGVNLVEARIRPVAVIVVLEKGQCDSHKTEIKNFGTHFHFDF